MDVEVRPARPPASCRTACLRRGLAVWACLALAAGCGRQATTLDVSHLFVRGYRYVADPRDPMVHVVAEVDNRGPQVVERAILVITGLGRNGQGCGETRKLLERLRPGERRVVQAAFRNRGRLATVQVTLEPAPQ
jgi:hypothetical protein